MYRWISCKFLFAEDFSNQMWQFLPHAGLFYGQACLRTDKKVDNPHTFSFKIFILIITKCKNNKKLQKYVLKSKNFKKTLKLL